MSDAGGLQPEVADHETSEIREYSFDDIKNAPKVGGLYLIVNRANGKVYAGSAVDFRTRWKLHRSQLRNGKHHSPILQRSYDKHGESSFAFVVVDIIEDPYDLVPLEQALIDSLNASDSRFGYNVCPTAGSVLGCRHSEETIAELVRQREDPEYRSRMSDRMRERWEDPDFKETMQALRESPEYKEKLSEGRRRTWEDPEFREKMDVARRKRWENQEYREKMNESTRMLWEDPEFKKKMSALSSERASERWSDQEFRAHMSDTMRKTMEDPDLRARIAESQRRLWDNPEHREKMTRANSESRRKLWEDPIYRAKASESIRKAKQDPGYQDRVSDTMRGLWSDPSYREKMMESRRLGREKREADHAERLLHFYLIPLLAWNPTS